MPFIFLIKSLAIQLKGRAVSPLLPLSTFCTKATEDLGNNNFFQYIPSGTGVRETPQGPVLWEDSAGCQT